MKKMLFAALMGIAISVSAFAAPTKVSARILSRFSAEFVNASDVQWKTTDVYAKATFVLEGSTVEVFYDLQGEKIGTSRAITVKSLPKSAQDLIAKKYAAYTVKEAISFTDTDEVVKQYVSLETEKTKVVLEISAAGDVSVLSKSSK